MAELTCTSMLEDYGRICSWVREEGAKVAPRGQETREILNASLEFTDPVRMLPVRCGRRVSENIAAVEALQLIGGFCDPQLIMQASGGRFAPFMDQGNFHGGYGLRTRMQIGPALERLRRDTDTRQAVVTMWDPLQDLFVTDAHDYPCTISLQFMIRDGALDLHVHMRSNDVWKGLAYDGFVFTRLQLQAAHCLELPVGRYFHHAASLHLYKENYYDVGSLVQPLLPARADPWHWGPITWDDRAFGHRHWVDHQVTARALAYGERLTGNATTAWYADRIDAIRQGGAS